jgi:cobyrinic acid a,c-diamide synthase
VAGQVDLERVLRLAATAEPVPGGSPPQSPAPAGGRLRIAVARDDAFGFYYPDDLAALRRGGADLVPFSPVHDPELPAADGVFIGGGFPEYRMGELEANHSMRESVREFIECGGPVYAECGGLMYLCRGLAWRGERRAMCGVLAAEVVMHERPQGRGYVRLSETEAFPWPAAAAEHREIRAHEFHHSAVVEPDPGWVFGYRVLRGTGVDGRHDGIVHRNLLAAYSHLRDVGGVAWTARFLGHVRRCAGG